MNRTCGLVCPHAPSTASALQGRRQEAHEFFRAMAEGSLQPLSPSGDAVALLMHDLLQHGDAPAAVGFFQALPRMPVRPPPSPALVAAAVDVFSACGRWSEAAAALASGARNAAASPAAAVGLMCNIARAAAALPQDAPQTAELLSTAHEARPRHCSGLQPKASVRRLLLLSAPLGNERTLKGACCRGMPSNSSVVTATATRTDTVL